MRKYRIKNKDIRDKVEVSFVVEKMKRYTDRPIMRCERLAMKGLRRAKGRPKKY